MDRRWTVKSDQALARARGLARDKAHAQVTTGHLLAALFEADNFVSLYLQRLGSDPDRTLGRVSAFVADLPAGSGPGGAADAELPLDAELAGALDRAARWADDLDDEYVSAENLLLGLAGGDDDIALTLQAAGVGRGGWQGVIRLRRELWERQVRPRPEAAGFDPLVVRVLLEATRRAGPAVVGPARVLEVLLAEATFVGALLAALGLDPTSVRQAAADIAGRDAAVPDDVLPPVLSPALCAAITASHHISGESAEVGALSMLRGLAQDRGEVGQLLRGVDEMLTVLTDRIREPAARLAGAVMAQQRAMRQSDLETAARLLHGEIPVLEQEIEAMGPVEAVLVKLLNDRPTPEQVGAEKAEEYERFRTALDTARTREISRVLLRWLGERDVTPGDPVELAAFCATIHDGPITGREAGHAAGRLALLGLVTRDDEAVRLTAAGLRCLEDRGGDPDRAAAPAYVR